jgi:predicted phosphodiesterase
MRLAILTDVHGNLPALQAALERIADLGCELIFHTGDAIGIGPYPAECLDLLLNRADTYLTMGNHDAWFAFGLPRPRPAWMSEGEVAHQDWVHAQLDPALSAVVARWPYIIRRDIEEVRVALVHYGLDESGRDFVRIMPHPTSADLDAMFAGFDIDLVFYGHHHPASDIRGRARYVSPGSLGCHSESLARFSVLDCTDGSYTLQHYAVPYDATALFAAFEARAVPERQFICRAFFGRK